MKKEKFKTWVKDHSGDILVYGLATVGLLAVVSTVKRSGKEKYVWMIRTADDPRVGEILYVRNYKNFTPIAKI
jgi:hypothetical protein